MNNFTKRLIFGLIYVLVVVIATSTNTFAFIFIFLGFLLFCTYELNNILKLKSIIPYFLNSALFITIALRFLNLNYDLFNINIELSKINLLVVLSFILISFISVLFSKEKEPIKKLGNIFLSFIYIGVPFSLIWDIYGTDLIRPNNSINIILGVFILIWTNDTFAYLVGRKFGKHKLFERISPKKTIEGFIGGIIFTLIAGYFISKFNYTYTTLFWLILAFIVSVFGTIGDLIESMFKRDSNIKDSSNLIPGHGGFLDRLDSFIFAIPFIYIFLILLT